MTMRNRKPEAAGAFSAPPRRQLRYARGDRGSAGFRQGRARGFSRAATSCGRVLRAGKTGPKPISENLAQEKQIKVFQFPSLKSDEARAAMKGLDAELGIMAFVLQFAPQDFVSIPRHGTIQYHRRCAEVPRSVVDQLADHPRDAKTGLSIFRPTDGLDEGR